MHDIAKRTPQFIVSIVVCIATLWIIDFSDFLLFKLLASILTLTACKELCDMFRLSKHATNSIMLVAIILPSTLLLSQYIKTFASFFEHIIDWKNIWLFFVVGVTILILLHKSDSKKNIHTELYKSILVLSLSTVYLTGPLYLLYSISRFDNALIIYFIPILSVAILDTSSYLCGKLFGGQSKSIFYLSPNKTFIGVICGVVVTLACIYIVIVQLHPPSSAFEVSRILLLIIIMISGGVIGDLFGSALKRITQVKDSGTLIKGRGGVIDSIDSLLFVVMLFWSSCPILVPSLWH